ncbi:hypothetical protein [Nonomuraea bangladeshensis]|uniref:hypothetical protein n=1 Tax=Nonomuraea bangladeshensis TaxID=404385 RepID=UPI003C2C680C
MPLFDVGADGSVMLSEQTARCASAESLPGDNAAVTLRGFTVAVDTHVLSQSLITLLLGWQGELRPQVNQLTLIPTNGYVLRDPQGTVPDVRFSVGADGTLTLLDAPAGVTLAPALPPGPSGGFTTLEVRRADDLLVLRFEFVNLVLDPDASAHPRRMIHAAPQDEAFVIVHFPPQHIAEEMFDLIDFSRGPRSYLSGESRLAFRLRSEALPLTIEGLLDWRNLEPSLAETPERHIPLTFDPHLLEPTDRETAIELPFRLILAPHPDFEARWEHHIQPGSSADGERVELWHTRLSSTEVRAIWSPDLLGLAEQDNFPLSLNPKNRAEIVQISSFQLNGNDLQHLSVDNPQGFDEAQRWLQSTRHGLSLDELTLSALGGGLRISSRFNFPAVPSVLVDDEIMLGQPFGAMAVEFFSLEDWSHTIAMGREQQARTVERGFLYPFGHQASLIKETHRIFVSNGIAAELESCLIRRDFLVVHEPERHFVNNHGMPFTSMRIMISRTPDLGLTQGGHFVPTVRGIPFAFPVRTVDHQGAVCDLEAAMVWVPVNETDWAGVENKYAKIKRILFSNERLAYVPGRSGPSISAGGSGNTVMTTLWAEFEARAPSLSSLSGVPTFEPQLSSAEVSVPSVEQLGVARQASAVIEYHEKYVAGGFGAVGEGVFARIKGGLPVEIPAQQAGGLINQGLALTGLSAVKGAVPNVDLLAGGVTAAPGMDGLIGKLLGVIDLPEIIMASLNPDDLPKITTAAQDGSHTVTYTWNPRLRHPLPPPLRADRAPAPGPVSAATLVITSKMSRAAPGGQAGGASTEIDGTLADIGLSFLDIVEVTFEHIRFHAQTGQGLAFDIAVKNVAFMGDLRFLEELATILKAPTAPRGRGSDGGPYVTVTREGVSAGIVLAVPDFVLGILSLRNLSFSSTINLYFSDKPFDVRFALSSREHPFIVSYAIFGGGGHFALTADTAGKVDVEAAVEFGATAAIDIILAKGTVEIMVGVLFSKRGEKIELGGYIRIFGCLEILGIVSISVAFYLSLTYAPPKARGRAEVTVSVRVLGFSKSVTLTVERSFNLGSAMREIGADGPRGFEGSLSQADWVRYCDAFAPLEVA